MTGHPLKLQHEIEQQTAFWLELTAEHERLGLPIPEDYAVKGACKPLFRELLRRGDVERFTDIGRKLSNVITVTDRTSPAPRDEEGDD